MLFMFDLAEVKRGIGGLELGGTGYGLGMGEGKGIKGRGVDREGERG